MRDLPQQSEAERFFYTENIYDEANAIEEFEQNAAYKKRRKNGIIARHTTLAFHPSDSDKVTPNIMQDLTQKFLELRTEGKAIVLAAGHKDTKSTHIHVVISANEIRSEKAIKRLNKEAFMQIRKEMEAYQLLKYPQLNNSLVYQSERTKNPFGKAKKIDRESKVKGKFVTSEKEILKDKINALAKKAYTLTDLSQILLSEGFQVYKYRGRLAGIKTDKRKYRFKTMGLDENVLAKLINAESRLKEHQNATRERKR